MLPTCIILEPDSLSPQVFMLPSGITCLETSKHVTPKKLVCYVSQSNSFCMRELNIGTKMVKL